MIPSHQPVTDQGIKDSKPLYSIEEEEFSKFSSEKAVNNPGNRDSKSPQNIKEEEFVKFEQSSLLTQAIDNDLSLLTPLKAPKSYGTYSKQQQEDVIAFIKDGHSLRTAEKVFGIPKSTMHCWLKKLHIKSDLLNTMKVDNYSDLNIETSFPYNNDTVYVDESETKVKPWKDSRSHNAQRKSSPPSSPIVIEESELIRFLQTNEGLEMIAKAYSVGVNDFLDFINSSKNKAQEGVKGLLVSSSSMSRPGDVIGLLQPQKKSLDVKDGNIKYYQQVSPNTARKRNLHNDYFNFDNKTSTYPGVAVMQKKIKVEQNTHDSNKDGYYHNNSNNNNNVIIKNNNDNNDSKNKSNKNRKKSNNKNNHEHNDDNNKNNSNTNSNTNSNSSNSSNINNNNNNSNNNNSNNNNNNNNNNNTNNTRGTNNNNGSLLATLLAKDSNQKPGTQKKLVLTTKQYLAANKIINSVQPDLVNTYLSSRPLLVNTVNSQQQSLDPQTNVDRIRTNNSDSGNNTQNLDQTSELSFGYPKVTNPVSIKAERLDSEITLPCDVSPNSGGMHYVRTLSPVVHSITKPVVTSNNSATLNLNVINRTQSEKELMAMVDGDNVSADELCAEFKETLELSKWVDNEAWYMDQYLQHFQVSPALTSPDSSLPDADSDDLDEEVNTGLTFAVDKDKEKKHKNVSHMDYENVNKLVPVTVKIFEPCKNTGEVWSTLSSPGHLSTSPHSRDGLLTSPRLYDGLLCSPHYQMSSPRKEQLLTHLQETGLDPNLIQPNFNNMNNN